jgi:hypothetical protein
MDMKKPGLAHLIAIAALLPGCDIGGIRGNGHVVTDQRALTDFTEVQADGYFEVEWHTGRPSCAITVDENLAQYIEASVTNNVLRLHTRERIWMARRLKATVTSNSLQGAKLTGACRFEANELSGSKFYVHSEGAAHIKVGGTVDELLADTEGAAKLDAGNLHTKSVQISTEGASRADVFATEALRVSISGAGKVTYGGNPKTVEKHISGAGSIRRND